jgi:hypothetical protein
MIPQQEQEGVRARAPSRLFGVQRTRLALH